MADGKLKEIESIHEIQSGCILREKGKEIAPFSDCVILKVDKDWNKVKYSRPYAFVSGAGTTSPTVLLGSEIIECPFDYIQRNFVQVLTDRENSYDFVT